MEVLPIKLTEIWRTCNKIRTAIARKFIDLPSYFNSLDPNKCGLISDFKFFNVIYNQLGENLCLCQEEVLELLKYFQLSDGRIAYQQFCNVICSVESPSEKEFVTGLEWEDPMHINVMTPPEHRQITMILTKIANSVRLREIVMKPYFQDYENLSNNHGTITIQHFRRVLNFMGITLGPTEFRLLLKKYLKHSYTVNYVAFIEDIEKIVKYFSDNNFLDDNEDMLINFPGRIITYELPKLPRPEVGTVDLSKIFDEVSNPHSSCNITKKDYKFEELMMRVKKHILENQIRTGQFFECYDPLRRGLVTSSQFLRGLDAIGLSCLRKLYLSQHDLNLIVQHYQDPTDPSRVLWKRFCDEIDEVFTIKNLDKQPYRVVECPAEDIIDMNKSGIADWNCESRTTQQNAQNAIFKIRNILFERRMLIEPFFRSFDKHNNYHVTRNQMRRILSMNSILLSNAELNALYTRYCDDMGFNYWEFLKEANDISAIESKYDKLHALTKQINNPTVKLCDPDLSIIAVLAKIKGEVVRKRIDIEQFLKCNDKLNEHMVPTNDFRRAFSNANIILSDCELDIVCKSFKVDCMPNFTNYKLFCDIINEAFIHTNMEKTPMFVPIKYLPSCDMDNFLNYDERVTLSGVLEKLSRFPDKVTNMKLFFEDYDNNHSGLVTECNVMRALTISGLNTFISTREFEALCKCFAVQKGNSRREFKYNDFLQVTSHLNSMK